MLSPWFFMPAFLFNESKICFSQEQDARFFFIFMALVLFQFSELSTRQGHSSLYRTDRHAFRRSEMVEADEPGSTADAEEQNRAFMYSLRFWRLDGYSGLLVAQSGERVLIP